MDKVLAIARRDYMVNFRRGGFQFWTWLVPALGTLALLAALLFGSQIEAFLDREPGAAAQVESVGVVDESGLFTPLLPAFQESMTLFEGSAEAAVGVDTRQVDMVLHVPADYLATGVIRVEDPEPGMGMTRLGREEIRTFVTAHLLSAQALEPAVETRLLQPVALVPVEQPGEAAGDWVMGAAPLVIGILFAMAIFTGSGYMLGGVTEEKNSRIMEVLVSSATPQQLLAGKIVGLGALSLTQLMVWVVSIIGLGSLAPLVIDSAPDILPVLQDQTRIWVFGAVFFLLGVVVYNTLFATIGALTNSFEESQMAGGVASMIAIIPFLFAGYTFAQPHGLYSQIMSYFPLTSPVMMLIRVGSPELATAELVAAVVVMAVAAAGALWLGGRLFAHGLLMYSGRPSLTQVLRGT